MGGWIPHITQAQLNILATAGALLAPLIALTIYYHRRYTRRKRIAGALIQEIQQNRYWANGQQPHYDQHGIVGLSETFQYPNQQFSSEEEWKESLGEELPTPKVVVPNYEAGDIPPSARASSTVYESTASEISRFNQDLAEDLVSYYHQLDYIKELNDIIHEGQELPPAAYSILSDNLDIYIIENEDLERELEIEMKRFPQTYRYGTEAKEHISNAADEISTRVSEVTES
ncbi:hypothetical protein [Halorhabdus sp. CUG00001]|uniref:hypothetical protein n=1 Tax=Halorhabdus sp. CUG00001 TaxID=2600297 RepID=UPI00131CC563|nr:hypothetical protein [Halorhabdus sp. CUG00001]